MTNKPASEAFLSVGTIHAPLKVEPGQLWWITSQSVTTFPTKMGSEGHKKEMCLIKRTWRYLNIRNRLEETSNIFLQSEGQIGHKFPCQ
jgi:hypothetical protein